MRWLVSNEFEMFEKCFFIYDIYETQKIFEGVIFYKHGHTNGSGEIVRIISYGVFSEELAVLRDVKENFDLSTLKFNENFSLKKDTSPDSFFKKIFYDASPDFIFKTKKEAILSLIDLNKKEIKHIENITLNWFKDKNYREGQLIILENLLKEEETLKDGSKGADK